MERECILLLCEHCIEHISGWEPNLVDYVYVRVPRICWQLAIIHVEIAFRVFATSFFFLASICVGVISPQSSQPRETNWLAKIKEL